jgi:hypothetical protein
MRASPRPLVPALAVAFLIGALPVIAPAQQNAPASSAFNSHFLGTWRLDLTKSRYAPGPPPRAETRVYARDATGVKGTIERHHADGRKEVIEYRADSDQDTPVSGTQAYDTARFRRVDDNTMEAVLSHAGRVYGYARRIISADGQTLTITFRREEPGDMVNNIAVYSRAK